MERRIASSVGLKITPDRRFGGADCLSVATVVSAKAARVAERLVAGGKVGNLDLTDAETNFADTLRGIGWLAVLNVRKRVLDGFGTYPRTTAVAAEVVDGGKIFIPQWILYDTNGRWVLFPEYNASDLAKRFHDWKNGGTWDRDYALVPQMGTPGARASLAELISGSYDQKRIEKVVRELTGVKDGRLTLEETARITDWGLDLVLAMAKEPRGLIENWLLRARGQIPTRALRIAFAEGGLGRVLGREEITLNNLQKGALVG